MLLKDCYDAFGGDYESVRQRISKDDIIKKFVIKFLSEPSYDNLCRALESESYEEAFRAAHSLKGVCANLAFKRLEASSGELTELLRHSNEEPVDKEKCKEVFGRVSVDYNAVMDAVRKLEQD